MANECRTLFLVFKEKDELFSNILRKLVEAKDDDVKMGKIVGTEDGSVNLVCWTEKQWRDQKGTVSTSEKVLFIGKQKGVEKLLPIIDRKYDKYGITYGWAGNQAVLVVDEKPLKNQEEYEKFFVEMKEKTNLEELQKDKKLGHNKETIQRIIGAILLPNLMMTDLIVDAFDDKKTVRNQQFCLGLFELYRNHLEDFMKQ